MPCGSVTTQHYTGPSVLKPSTSAILTRLCRNTVEEKEREDMTPLAFKLRREERRRKLFRNVSFKTEDKTEIVAEKDKTVVKDRFGNEVYVRGESGVEKASRELEQWINKMRCNSATGVKLEHFKDIKVRTSSSTYLYDVSCKSLFEEAKKKTLNLFYLLSSASL